MARLCFKMMVQLVYLILCTCYLPLLNITYHNSLDDSHRPVKLRKIVLGFPMHKNMNEFCFDMTMNYKLSGIIHTYSDRKPTLVVSTFVPQLGLYL